MTNIANIWIWLGFTLFLLVALSIDMLLFGKKHARMHSSMRAILCWTLVWVSLALLFNGLLWFYLYVTVSTPIANQKALEFFTGYVIEKSLSFDNLFVFYIVFQQFHIPIASQQRVLSYGIWSAIVLRLLFILLGVWVVTKFHWVLYLMGAFLLFTGIKILFFEEKHRDVTENMAIRVIKRFMRVTNELHGKQFFIRKGRLLYVTPLFLALIFIEISDLVFSLDSIPAIFAVTTDPFIVWSSNIFAILGLRTLYFLLASMVQRFELLKYGVALILIFVGGKMLLEYWVKIPVLLSLGMIVAILLLFTVLSLWHKPRSKV